MTEAYRAEDAGDCPRDHAALCDWIAARAGGSPEEAPVTGYPITQKVRHRRHSHRRVLEQTDGAPGPSVLVLGMRTENRAGGAARNDLLAMSSGDWLQYLDADDYLLTTKISGQVAALERFPEVDVLLGPGILLHDVNGHMVIENLEILEREGLVDNARDVGTYLLERLRKSFGNSPIVGEIRGLGLLTAIEIVRDRESKQPFPNTADAGWIARAAFERGLIARALFQCIGLCPPLCATPNDVDRMVAILEDLWPEAERRFAGKV